MRKRHFIASINAEMSKTMKNVNCDVNIEAKVKMQNLLHVGLPDVDLIICNKDLQYCILRCYLMLRQK